MPDWKNKAYYKGTPLKVVLCDKNETICNGTLLTNYIIDSEENEHPRILLKDGTLVEGCECWWIPIEETK